MAFSFSENDHARIYATEAHIIGLFPQLLRLRVVQKAGRTTAAAVIEVAILSLDDPPVALRTIEDREVYTGEQGVGRCVALG